MPHRVAIVGAGITGLVTGLELQKRGVEVVVYEASDRPGGALRSVRRDGFLAEHGPHTLLVRNEAVAQLTDDLDLADQVLWASEESNKRYMVKDGRPVALPASPPALLKSDVYSTRAKLKLLREPFVPRRDDGVDESVTNFITRRLDPEFLDYGVELLVNGVWAGDPNRLSARYAFSRMYGLERDYGSLVKGGIALARRRSGPPPRMMGFRDGNEVLARALADRLDDLRLERPVRTVRRTDEGWRVRNGIFDEVVFTVGAHVLREATIEDNGTVATDFFDDVAYPSVAVVTLGFRADQIAHPLDGFGMIAPMREGLDILGSLFCSTLFEHRAPKGHVTIATFVGGMRRPDLDDLGDEARQALVVRELRKTLGVKGEPVFVEQAVWKRAIPQYEVGYGRLRARMDALEQAHPGLRIAGNIRQGVAVPDLIEAGAELASNIARGQREA
jgi:oxygen-dependent protoporphyrinogen oxidase